MLLDGVRFTASNRRSLMGDNGTTSLLILQDREMNLERIERSLESLPRERESIQKKIAAFDSEIEEGKQRIKSAMSMLRCVTAGVVTGRLAQP